jgi:hypothetical protein
MSSLMFAKLFSPSRPAKHYRKKNTKSLKKNKKFSIFHYENFMISYQLQEESKKQTEATTKKAAT